MGRLIKVLDIIVFIFLSMLVFCLPFSNAIVEICACNAIVWWLIKKILAKRLYNKISFLPKTFLNLAILIYLSMLLISILQGSSFMLGFKNLTRKTLEYVGLFLILVDTLNSKKRVKIVFYVFICSISLISIDCIIQYLTKFEFLRHRVAVAGRIAGPFEYPDEFGNYLVTVFPMILIFSFYRFRRVLFKYFLRIILVVLFFLLLVNSTKGAWIAFFLSFIFLFYLYPKKNFLIYVLIFLTVFFFFLPSDLKSTVLNQFRINQPSINQRIDLWQTGWNMFKDRPIFGQGLGTYMSNYKRYQLPRFRTSGEQGIWYAHNSYLQMMAEVGIFGLVSFLGIIFILFKTALKLVRNYKDIYLSRFLLALLVGILAYLIQIFFDSTFYSLPNSFLFWYFLALLVATITLVKKQIINND